MFYLIEEIRLLPLQGVSLIAFSSRALPWADSSLAFQAANCTLAKQTANYHTTLPWADNFWHCRPIAV